MAATYHQGDEPIQGYQLLDTLEFGSIGQTWQASDPERVDIAMRMIALNGARRVPDLSPLRNIRHPGIIPVLGYWLRDKSGRLFSEQRLKEATDGGSGRFSIRNPTQCIISIELGGQSLLERCLECLDKKLPGIGGAELLDYMETVSETLQYLYTAEEVRVEGVGPIGHGLINPRNIVIRHGKALLCDWGIQRLFGEQIDDDRSAGLVYLAPEQRKGHITSLSADQYSLALTYLHMRVGETPKLHPETFEADLIDLPKGERLVLERALSPTPSNRYATPCDMVEALRRAGAATNVVGGVSSNRAALQDKTTKEDPSKALHDIRSLMNQIMPGQVAPSNPSPPRPPQEPRAQFSVPVNDERTPVIDTHPHRTAVKEAPVMQKAPPKVAPPPPAPPPEMNEAPTTNGSITSTVRDVEESRQSAPPAAEPPKKNRPGSFSVSSGDPWATIANIPPKTLEESPTKPSLAPPVDSERTPPDNPPPKAADPPPKAVVNNPPPIKSAQTVADVRSVMQQMPDIASKPAAPAASSMTVPEIKPELFQRPPPPADPAPSSSTSAMTVADVKSAMQARSTPPPSSSELTVADVKTVVPEQKLTPSDLYTPSPPPAPAPSPTKPMAEKAEPAKAEEDKKEDVHAVAKPADSHRMWMMMSTLLALILLFQTVKMLEPYEEPLEVFKAGIKGIEEGWRNTMEWLKPYLQSKPNG